MRLVFLGSDGLIELAAYFVRQKDKRMLVVYAGEEPCVAELWKIHTE